MAHALTPYRPILLCAWQQHRNLGSRWLLPLLALLCLGTLLTLGLAVDWQAALFTGQALALLLLLLSWPWLFANLRRQNHPASAHLVPQHLRRLRTVAVAALLGFSALGGLLLSLSTGHALAWGLGLACVMLAIAACLRWPSLWLWGWFLPLPYWIWPRSPVWPALKQALQNGYTEQPAALALFTLLPLCWALSRLLQASGNTHFKSYQAQEDLRLALQEQMRGGLVTPKTLSPSGAWLIRLFSWPRPLWMAHLLKRAHGGPGSVMARVDLVTLGTAHWAHVLGAISIILSLTALLILITQAIYAYDWRLVFKPSNIGLQIGIISMAINPLFALAGSLYSSRREQALLMLLPTMPRGPALNAALGRRLLLQFGLQWLIAWLLVAGLLQSATAEAMPHWHGLHILLAALPLSSLLLRDWARQARPTGSAATLIFVLICIFSGLIAALQACLALDLWPFALASALLTLGLVYTRWRRWVRGGPQAMPVGRLSS
ncbi:hypothetical protein HNP55_001217 [Paucibacter oligotrophus]|uniref:Uncharacterized protein n=1 Tax=Roseateles oligotrophus TaxID=1769250 RepID=A0A840L7P3_9BURK|nr:hypothetical protein [Roseateles oligotrophus]MBB4842702.1 hypothetical protein [Roseateles oligotrophus]